MPKDDFLEGYDGQTTDELIELDERYRTDSVVLAFEQAISQAAAKCDEPIADRLFDWIKRNRAQIRIGT